MAACAAERRALCAAGQRGGGVGAHARRINTACPAVHGKYARSPDDSNGLFGTWYIGLSELVQTFGKEVVATKVAEFEAAATAAREEALGAIELEGEEEAAPPT